MIFLLVTSCIAWLRSTCPARLLRTDLLPWHVKVVRDERFFLAFLRKKPSLLVLALFVSCLFLLYGCSELGEKASEVSHILHLIGQKLLEMEQLLTGAVVKFQIRPLSVDCGQAGRV